MKPSGGFNQEWLARSQASVWHPCTQMQHHQVHVAQTGDPSALPLIPIERGQGAWLYDFEGKAYLDGISSWWTNLFGHAHPHINRRIREQLERLEHVMLAGFTHRPVIELSEQLAARTGHCLGHAFYASDGASATEIALKMSVHYWRNAGKPEKNRFLCLAGSYHGETVGALAVTDVPLFSDAYRPLLRPAHVLMSPDQRLAGTGEEAETQALKAAQDLDSYLAAHAEVTAALIVEPLVQGAGGMAMYDPIYLLRARELCTRYGVHLIFDEIAVGFGRTGTFFAHEQAIPANGDAPIRPDFLCLSKGLSSGYLPLSAVLCTDDIYEAFLDPSLTRAFLHSHSFTGNPLACTAALASLELFEQYDILTVNQENSRKIWAGLQALSDHPQVRHLRQKGMITAFDVVSDDPYFSRRFYRAALDLGALIRPMGNTVYLMPPYIVSDPEIAQLTEVTQHALIAALGEAS